MWQEFEGWLISEPRATTTSNHQLSWTFTSLALTIILQVTLCSFSKTTSAVSLWTAVIHFPAAYLQHLPQPVKSTACPVSSTYCLHCAQNTVNIFLKSVVCMSRLWKQQHCNASRQPVFHVLFYSCVIHDRMRFKDQKWPIHYLWDIRLQ